jgi:hypothetical protein
MVCPASGNLADGFTAKFPQKNNSIVNGALSIIKVNLFFAICEPTLSSIFCEHEG